MRPIKELCDEKGITIDELSQKVGFDVVDFEYRAYNDKIDPKTGGTFPQGIGIKQAIKLCEALEIQFIELFEKKTPGSEPKMFTIHDTE
jgi:hypothetical protein